MATIKALIVGDLYTNCYVVIDEKTKETIIIDPGFDFEKIDKALVKEGCIVKKILLTHAHFDHITAVKELVKKYKPSILIHKADEPILKEASLNFSGFYGEAISIKPDVMLSEGDIVKAGDTELKVIHTPGHTPGSICLLIGDILIAGDTLFNAGIGRTDFPYGSEEDIYSSIKNKLFKLPDSTKVYPGHGIFTTIGEEKKNLM